jgi:hypothetical protein
MHATEPLERTAAVPKLTALPSRGQTGVWHVAPPKLGGQTHVYILVRLYLVGEARISRLARVG